MTAGGTAAPASARLISRLVALVFFIQLLDATIIVTSLPKMAADFGVAPVAMSVGVTVYLLAMAVVLPAAGWIGERFGARRVLIASVSLFTAASLACGLSGQLDVFVASRIAQGAAAALMAPVGRMLVLRNAPKSELMNAIATITWPALFAPVIGPVLGAWITETLGWRWNFFINLPLGLAAIILFLALAPAEARGAARRFDSRGFALCAAALLCLLGGFELFVAGHDPVLSGAPILAGAASALLAARHLHRSAEPLFDLSILRIPSFRIATMTAGTLGRTAINSTPFLLPLLLQVGFSLSPLAAGQLVLIYFLGNLAMKSVTTPIMRRFGFRQVLTANGLMAALSIAVLAGTGANLPVPLLWATLFFAGATRSLQFTALNTLAFADVGPSERATSATLSSMTQQIAMLLGVALSVALIRASEGLRGAETTALIDFRLAMLAMAAIGVASALCFIKLSPETGREVSGHVAALRQ